MAPRHWSFVAMLLYPGRKSAGRVYCVEKGFLLRENLGSITKNRTNGLIEGEKEGN